MSIAAWIWAIRDARDKPPPGQLAVLLMLGARMDPATGCGWTRRIDLMADAGVKRDTVTAATVWAIKHGLVRRLDTGRRRGDGSVSYSLWTITDPARPEAGTFSGAAQGAAEDDGAGISGAAQGAAEESQGRNGVTSRAAQGALSSKTRDVRPEEPAAAGTGCAAPGISGAAQGAAEDDGEVLTGTPVRALTAQDIVAEWIEQREHRPTSRTVGQIAKYVKAMLAEGIDCEHIRAGLAAWQAKGNLHAAALDSFVNAAMNGAGNGHRPPGSDARVAAGMALAEHYRQIEQQEGET